MLTFPDILSVDKPGTALILRLLIQNKAVGVVSFCKHAVCFILGAHFLHTTLILVSEQQQPVSASTNCNTFISVSLF